MMTNETLAPNRTPARPVLLPFGPVQEAEFARLLVDFAAGSAARDRDRIPPFAEIAKLKQLRFGAYRLEIADGGAGASFRQLFQRIIQLGAADSNIAHILRNHFAFVERFARLPTPQGRFWRDRVAEGAIFGLANADKAKDAPALLHPQGDGYLLSGEKFYTTGTLYADYVVVRASVPDGRAGTAIVRTDTRGIDRRDDWDSAGQRLTGSGTTVFDAARVECDEVVFDGDASPYDAPYKSTLPQLFLTAVNAGILAAVLRDALALMQQRKSRAFYHAPTADPNRDPLLLKLIGDLSARVSAAELLVMAAADAQDALDSAGRDDRKIAHHAALQAAKAKVIIDGFVAEAGWQVFDMGGASSTQTSHNLDRHWRNARTLASHNPAHLKAHAIGDHELNGTPLPDTGFF